MSRRSVMNERYTVEQKSKSKTRRSASSAKPKRQAGEASSSAASKPVKRPVRKGLFGAKAPRPPMPRIPMTPEIKKLRRVWWVLMAAAVALALVMIPAAKAKSTILNGVLFFAYAIVLGGALYLEFGPLRRARVSAAATIKPGGKKTAKAAAVALPAKAPSLLGGLFGFGKKPKDDAAA